MAVQSRIFAFVLVGAIALLVSIGCSSVKSNPVGSPDLTSDVLNSFISVSEVDSNGNPLEGQGTLGLFEVHINTVTFEGDIHSMRGSSAEDVLEIVDITNFLQVSPCVDCVQINSIELNGDGNLVVNIGIKHPFAAGNPMEPISGRNRGDLHVFNIEGTVVAETSTNTVFGSSGQVVGDFRLVNADGYSAYLDDALDGIFTTTGTIHPYVLHFDDYSSGNYDAANPMGFLSVTDPPPSGNLIMAMGCDYDVKTYEFDFTSSDINFIFAIGCTYAVSADNKILRFTPEYRVPQHLKKAASEVAVRITDNQLQSGDTASTATLQIDVVDINHGVAVGTGLNEMKADSSVGAIRLDIPGVLTNGADVTLTNIGGTGHDSTDPLTYEIIIENEQGAITGTYPALVKVSDAYPVGQNGSPLLIGNDGIMRVEPIANPLEGLFAIAEFATYQVFDIEVQGVVNNPPVAELLPDPANAYQGYPLNFNGTNSYDTDGTVDLYEFDYDWDGVEANFVADTSNTTGTALSDTYDTLGTFTAGLRVTDDLGAVGYDSVTVEVTEYTNECPLAPFSGSTITSNLIYGGWEWMATAGWETDCNQTMDVAMMSNGQAVLIYSDLETSVQGDMRIFDPSHNGFSSVGSDYPGRRGACIEVDSTDMVIFVLSTLPLIDHSNSYETTPDERTAASDDYFTVVDPTVGSSSEQVVNVGTTIAAIDIDGYDNVWVLDSENVMHMFDKSTGYTEDTNRLFDLDTTTSGAFVGNVHDFAINFYNEAFYILTDNHANGELWRIECDGIYHASVSGNSNPMSSILSDDTQGIADIDIDNLDASGNHLGGDQDSQIVVVGGNYDVGWDSLVATVDADLGQLENVVTVNGDGLTVVFFEQRTNQLWGFQRGMWAGDWTEYWDVPAGWQ